MMVKMLQFFNKIFIEVGVWGTGKSILIEEGTNKTHFLQERYE